MGKTGALKRTLTVTKNPLAGLELKRSKNRKTIRFKNGFIFKLTWPQFRVIRDNYPLLQRYEITQQAEDLFKITCDKSEVACNASQMPLMCDLMQKYIIRQIETDLFNILNDQIDLVGTTYMLGCIQEQGTGEYNCDCKDKIVLDVGGYQGESAVYFTTLGAKKVIVYEPVTEHIDRIKRNTSKNNVNAEIHNEGVGEKDTAQTISYTEMDTSFGLEKNGQHQLKIKIKNVADVIEESSADLAKFDCEGAETCLVNVPAEILRKIELYMIEVHSPEIKQAINGKFKSAGFALEREATKSPQLSVLTFKRK